MIVSFTFGIFRAPWWWAVLLGIAAFAFDQFVLEPQRAAWQTQAGIERPGGAGLAFLLTLALNVIAYGVGRGGRELWDRMNAKSPRRSD